MYLEIMCTRHVSWLHKHGVFIKFHAFRNTVSSKFLTFGNTVSSMFPALETLYPVRFLLLPLRFLLSETCRA